jgi:hypothetical protein
MPVIDLDSAVLTRGQNAQSIMCKRGQGGTRISGSPLNVRKVLFLIADVVFPGWFENKQGRETYLRWAEQCQDGQLNVTNAYFWDKAKDRVVRHLELDGVIVYEVSTAEKD